MKPHSSILVKDLKKGKQEGKVWPQFKDQETHLDDGVIWHRFPLSQPQGCTVYTDQEVPPEGMNSRRHSRRKESLHLEKTTHLTEIFEVSNPALST